MSTDTRGLWGCWGSRSKYRVELVVPLSGFEYIFFFSWRRLTKVKKPCLPNYLSSGGRTFVVVANELDKNIMWVRTPVMLLPYLPTPPLEQDMTQGQFFKLSLTGLYSEFSFCETSCLTKAEEPGLSHYLPIAGGRIIGLIPFPRVLVLCEMQSVSFRIWTRVAVSISYDDNHYTTGTSSHTITFTFGRIALEKVWTSLSPHPVEVK